MHAILLAAFIERDREQDVCRLRLAVSRPRVILPALEIGIIQVDVGIAMTGRGDVHQPSAASYQRQPVSWAVYGDNAIFIGPTPDQTYAIEVDSVVLPTPFAVGDTTTIDNIPPMCQDPIKFYAAYLAKSNAQSYGEAEKKLEEYQRRVREVVSVYTGRLPDVYQG